MTSETSLPANTNPSTGAAAPSSTPSREPNRLGRALGITDRHGWFLAWWQALVVGTAFVVISLIGYHSPQPRDVPVAVIGSVTQVAQLEDALEKADPSAYDLSPRTGEDADRALRRGDVHAVVDLSGDPTIRYAGAQGPTVFAALVRTLVPAVSTTSGGAPALVDALPLGANDAAALPLFYLSFAVVLASYLFSITTTNQARGLGAWGHWTSAVALAISLGVLSALFARYGTETITAHSPTVALVLALTSLATGATSYLLLTLSRTFGSILGTVILVILGSASGGVVPGPFLPTWLAALRPVLPMGVSLGTTRDLVYFGGQHTGRGVFILLLWAVIPLVVASALARRRIRGSHVSAQ